LTCVILFIDTNLIDSACEYLIKKRVKKEDAHHFV